MQGDYVRHKRAHPEPAAVAAATAAMASAVASAYSGLPAAGIMVPVMETEPIPAASATHGMTSLLSLLDGATTNI